MRVAIAPASALVVFPMPPCGDPPQVPVALLWKPESLLGLVEGLVGSLV